MPRGWGWVSRVWVWGWEGGCGVWKKGVDCVVGVVSEGGKSVEKVMSLKVGRVWTVEWVMSLKVGRVWSG